MGLVKKSALSTGSYHTAALTRQRQTVWSTGVRNTPTGLLAKWWVVDSLQGYATAPRLKSCLGGGASLQIISRTIRFLISLKVSTPAQNRQLNIFVSHSKQQVNDFVGELTF